VNVRGDRIAPPDRTGASVTVVTRPMIEALPGGDTQPLPAVLATQPGFVPDTFGLQHSRAADGGVAYVIDGVPLLTIPLGQFGNFVPMRMVQELQITTGGFPAEYGYAYGAVVDVTTRHATGGPEGQAQLLYGSYQRIVPSFNYSQEVGRASFLVGGSFETTQRGLDPPAASPILHDGLLQGSAFARADYLLGDQDHIELLAGYLQSLYQVPIDPTLLPLSAAPPGAVRGVDSYGNPPPPFVPYNANQTEGEKDLFVALAYTHQIGSSGVLHVAPYVRESYGLFSCDPAGTLGPSADPGSTCADVGRNALHEGVAADYSWKAGEHHALKVGTLVDVAEGQDTYSSYFRSDTSPTGGADSSRTLSGQDRTNILLAGVYAQDKISVGKWTIFPGLRLDTQQASYPGSDEPSLSLVGPSARLGTSYAITDDLVVHAFGGYLWQPPIVLDGPVAARILDPSLAGQPVPDDLKAETDFSGEVGVAGRILRRIKLSLTAWGRIADNPIDRQIVGNTNLYVSYNYARGRAAGAEAAAVGTINRFVDGFANFMTQMGQGQGVASEKYLFTPAELAFTGWSTLDHVQLWTVNTGFDLHDANKTTHLSGLFNYGSGTRTGYNDTEHVPSHSTLDLTLRHRFSVPLHPEVALDVFNVFDEVYATRIGNGYIGSAYGALRHGDIRLTVPFGS
jgi:outer membrane cobalamin receptor